MLNTLLALALVITAFATALAALLVLSFLTNRRSHSLRRFNADDQNTVVFLFENEHLVDATKEAQTLLASGPRTVTEWTHLTTLLLPRFPGFPDWIRDLVDMGEMSMTSSDGTSRLDAEWHDGVARIALVDVETGDAQVDLDRHALTAMRHELDTLRATAEHVPYLVWREDEQGVITWANRAYLDLVDNTDQSADIAPWPPRHLFDLPHLAAVDGNAPRDQRRVALSLPEDDQRHWFDIHETMLDGEILFTATPADKVVRAETALTEFVTTLTKTFAHLPIGLAIFDRDRKLVLFNPALNDLVALPIEFLCGKPTLFSFLDRMREKRMMPEPKDYKSWRQQMSDLEAQAIDGTYEETWALPTGQTYRVTGRPHPDGAVAFLFEDISAEISLTRRFRTELEMGQSALDCMPEAVAIFRPSGVLAMSNSAYADVWGSDPSTTFVDLNLSDAVGGWKRQCTPTPVWERLKTFVSHQGERTPWTASIARKDGRILDCRFEPMARGATLAAFKLASDGVKDLPADAEPLAIAKV
ncbi:PAS-domain containing protein [Aliiroseovarius subalbicans]|uniref:PAS-domain containing protein n=1 Tax=Aliiroseovarius subalbicans TaxID=2925840 RepID=UPI001F5A5207|nr:PAS-domain containing protein [Aliiroseovarius subalbicans]MCI2400029.1 PAS-domain containing protein [Aliiroseovarius subalbicans]